MPCRFKFCGLRTRSDVRLAVELGAEAIGFVLSESPRRIDPGEARWLWESEIDRITRAKPLVCGVVGPLAVEEVVALYHASGVDVMQVHGSEERAYWDALTAEGIPWLRAFRMRGRETLQSIRESTLPWVVLDAYKPGVPGGTGETFDWALAREARAWTEVILAGGLTPENVREAIAAADPWMVDVSGGIESAPGRKDPARMRAFAEAVRGRDDAVLS